MTEQPEQDAVDQEAEKHWLWLAGLLAKMECEFGLDAMGYVYKTAFRHGWKHGIEEHERTR